MRGTQWWLTVVALAAVGSSMTKGQVASAEAGRPAAKTSAQTSTIIPYTTDRSASGGTGGPLVRVTLNKGVPATFLLDTGTSDCCVTDTMAAKLRLVSSATGRNASALLMNGGRVQSVPLTLQVGRFRFARYPTMVVKAGRFPQVLGRPLDGVIGLNLLQRFALILEPQTHKLFLITPGRLTETQRQTLGFRHAGALPLTRADTGQYQATVGLGNGARTAIEALCIDTGAGSSVLSHAVAHSLSLTPFREGLTVPFGSGVFTGDLASVPAVTLGSVMDGSAPAVSSLVQRDSAFLYSSSPEAAGGTPHVLGMNILSGYSVLLDFPGMMLYLQPVTAK